MTPLCSRRGCKWPATHTADANRPPYAGPAPLCREHAHALLDGMRDGVRFERIPAMKDTP